MVKVPRAALCIPGSRKGGHYRLSIGGFGLLYRNPWTIVGNMFGENHSPCTLKASFEDFDKTKFFVPTHLSILL
jgi:hypothetical protein